MRHISILGDSISTFQGVTPEGWRVFYEGEAKGQTDVTEPADTWWHKLIVHYGATLHRNASFSGSTVMGVSFPAGCSLERAQALAANDVAPDAVVIFFGINDYGWGYSQWQVNFRSLSAPVEGVPEPDAPEAGNVDPIRALEEFEDAYSAMLGNIRTLYPQAEVWCCTLVPGRWEGQPYSTHIYQMRGAQFDDYNEAIRRAAVQTGCNLADVAALGCDYTSIDGTHPTKRGMTQLAALIAKAMRNGGCTWDVDPENALNVDGLIATCPRSERRCDKTTCVGCPHAMGVGNRWWCVCKRDMI